MSIGSTGAGHARPELLVGGRYRLLHRLGSGGYGRVWLAHDTALAVDVAVKEVLLPPSLTAEEQATRLARAEREARNAARLRGHPNVVAVYDVVIADGVPWTVMQLVRGRSLLEQVAAAGPLPPAQTTRVAEALLRALSAAHQAGLLHRDVKPANVLLADDGGVLLTDFGIAVWTGDPGLTAAGAVVGSAEYLAPERVRGKEAGPPSDLFSLGVTLYEAVEGLSPFRRAETAASFGAVLLDTPSAPQHASGALGEVIRGLMIKEPELRMTADAALALLAGPGVPDGVSTAAPLSTAPTDRPPAPTTQGMPGSQPQPQPWPTPPPSPAGSDQVPTMLRSEPAFASQPDQPATFSAPQQPNQPWPVAPPTDTAPQALADQPPAYSTPQQPNQPWPAAAHQPAYQQISGAPFPQARQPSHRPDPARAVVPLVLLAYFAVVAFLPAFTLPGDIPVVYHTWQLFRWFPGEPGGLKTATAFQLVGLATALALLAALSPRRGPGPRVLAYLAVLLVGGLEVFTDLHYSGPWTFDIPIGPGYWAFWSGLAVLAVAVVVRDVATRPPVSATR